MNTKRKGSRNEHRSKALLEADGYRITKSGASLGEWDLIGIGPSDFVVVQVKTNRWPGSAEMNAMREFPVPANCHKLIHRWRNRRIVPDVIELP